MAHKNHAHYAVPVVVSAIFLLLSFVSPRLLHPLNIAWMKLGAFLHKVMNPLVLGGIYFFLITPIAIFFRLKGRDVMQQRFDPLIETYWVKRNPAGPESKSFSRQF